MCNSRAERISGQGSRAWEERCPCPGQSLRLYSPESEQEDKALSFQQQISKEQTPVPWDSTNRSLAVATPQHRSWGSPVGAAVGSALLRSGAASLELRFKWFSKEIACGSPGQLFPSSQQ